MDDVQYTVEDLAEVDGVSDKSAQKIHGVTDNLETLAEMEVSDLVDQAEVTKKTARLAIDWALTHFDIDEVAEREEFNVLSKDDPKASDTISDALPVDKREPLRYKKMVLDRNGTMTPEPPPEAVRGVIVDGEIIPDVEYVEVYVDNTLTVRKAIPVDPTK
jgi:hypothetical protein